MARKVKHPTRHHGDERDHDPHHERDHHLEHDGHEDDNGNEGDGGEDDGDSPARQAAIIALRWLGSVPPTAELYARARQQWLALPGATLRSSAEVQLPAQPPSAAPTHDDGEGAL
jgi:hypothetical protein